MTDNFFQDKIKDKSKPNRSGSIETFINKVRDKKSCKHLSLQPIILQ